METIRSAALTGVVTRSPANKVEITRRLASTLECGALDRFEEPGGIPGRPERPQLVPHKDVPQRSVHTLEGRAALIHSLCHIELNAVDLALDIVWRFPALPDDFYRQWVKVAQEEAYHFTLLRDHLQGLGYEYGDFNAHNSLWEMAEKTKDDILARLALVPRTLEARGLDASPAVKAKLLSAGDREGAAIIDIILRDEVGHVAIGNCWYRWECERRGLDPVTTYDELTEKYGAPRPRGPFNLEARRAAGFTEDELSALEQKRGPVTSR